MKLTLTPDTVTSVSTISKLDIAGAFECYVLEPPNPIPPGTYEILLQHSERFGRIMPFLQNVPGHTAIEIHYGNTVANTRDCLLVGVTKGVDFVGESGIAFEALFAKLEKELTNTIEIRRVSAAPKVEVVPVVLQPLKGVTMADPTTVSGKMQLTNHAPVTASLVAGAATSIFLALAKAKYGLDLSGQEGNLTLLIGALVGYFTKGAIA